MRVFVPISGNKRFNQLAFENPSRLGHIISPSYYLNPREGIPFVLDNDAFGCWKRGVPFDELSWFRMVEKVTRLGFEPQWCIIPDVVCNKNATLESWHKYQNQLPHWKKAFVLQNGISLKELPTTDLYFVGGDDSFKWTTARFWCTRLPRVHIGRVRSKRLAYCERIGAESCDGSGWLRETVRGRPFRQLEAWLLNAHLRQLHLFSQESPVRGE